MARTATINSKVISINSSKENKDKKIKKLEKFLALYIQRAADLLKENQELENDLEKAKKQQNYLRKYYEKSKKGKIQCDRNKIRKAMVEYADIDLSEVIGSK